MSKSKNPCCVPCPPGLAWPVLCLRLCWCLCLCRAIVCLLAFCQQSVTLSVRRPGLVVS